MAAIIHLVMDMDEKTLIHAAQNGDIASFNQLVLLYQDLAYSQALWMMKNRVEAEDFTQEAFIKAHQRLSTFRGVSFRSWLLRIVTNTCLDELRQRKRAHQVPLVTWSEDGEEQDFSELLVDPGPSIEERVERTELRASLHRSLDELQVEYRDTIYLVDVLGLNYQEAAQVLGVPMGTVKSRVARGRLSI